MKRGFVFLTVLMVAATLLAGCTSIGSPSAITDKTSTGLVQAPDTTIEALSSKPSTGTIRVLVTDAPGLTLNSVVVHFSEVLVHQASDDSGSDGNWTELELISDAISDEDGDKTIDLAKLTDGATMTLAETEIELTESVKFTQIRVIMDEGKGATVDYTYGEDVFNGIPAKLPSGKLKFVRPFTVVPGEVTVITLDFILEDSVVFAGANPTDPTKVIIKPVVKLSVESEDQEPSEGIGPGTLPEWHEAAQVQLGWIFDDPTNPGDSLPLPGWDKAIDDIPVWSYDAARTVDFGDEHPAQWYIRIPNQINDNPSKKFWISWVYEFDTLLEGDRSATNIDWYPDEGHENDQYEEEWFDSDGNPTTEYLEAVYARVTHSLDLLPNPEYEDVWLGLYGESANVLEVYVKTLCVVETE